ncbi:hypothetical protein M9Y10_016278 [Tritrichomonas musculus]|uniref:4-alpha-glucanotransferase n=1 Tax=Tritrichomonas musculus TaxID=1915356 RepID=A0ABR2HVT3_9EUKA
MSRNASNDIIIYFRTKYQTYPGQILFLIGDHPLLGSWNRTKAIRMSYCSREDFNWEVEIRISPSQLSTDCKVIKLEYKYIVISSNKNFGSYSYNYDIRFDNSAEICWDTGPNRCLIINNNINRNTPLIISTGDLFQPPIPVIQNLFFKKTFINVIYRHEFDFNKCIIGLHNTDTHSDKIQVRFRIIALQIPQNFGVYITGSLPIFKNWEHFEPLTAISPYLWEYVIELPRDSPSFDYKYLILNNQMKPPNKPVWEQRGNRRFMMPNHYSNVVVYFDWIIQLPPQKFRGTGILAGLFSIHSKKSINQIGEFPDIKLLVDWAVKANILNIQLLPIQDTLCYYAKNEENISRLVSAFAFNPIYLSLRLIDGYEPVEPPNEGDMFSVSRFKLQHLRNIFDKKVPKLALMSNSTFQQFVKKNEYWLPSYCFWCVIRDSQIKENTIKNTLEPPKLPRIEECKLPNFLEMNIESEDYGKMSEDEHFFVDCLFHCWVQYQCHLQLIESSKYAIEKGVVLSTTITIGQNLMSSECWSHPELFDMNYTTGSPPDNFSFHGQNWFYPSWKWERMFQDDFKWLRMQMNHRETYFQAATFDNPHFLFRMWNIPSGINNPLFGHYVPSIPISSRDLQEHDITDISRLYRPIFPMSDVQSFSMPEDTRNEIIERLAAKEGEYWLFKANLRTDRDIISVFKELKKNCSLEERLQLAMAKKILLSNFESVCLIPDSDREDNKLFYPRYSMTDSTVFKTLPEREAQILYKMFVDFYYRSNISLWHENGQKKLCVLASSQMQFYGYDLCVSLADEEKILNRLGICSCHSQRVPREPSLRFEQTTNFPYLSVSMPSSHDMPHLAIWWKDQQADVQQFYHQILKMEGSAPLSLSPKIANAIINLHLKADSMWCFLVFEDLFALTEEFEEVKEMNEWMIEPTTKGVKCSYRMGICLEDLIENHEQWTHEIAKMIENAQRGRNLIYT